MLAIKDDIDTFDPVALSLPENQFLIDHLGKAPAVVARIPLPVGVNAKAVMPVIEKVYGLLEVEKHDNEAWVGLDALKARCRLYLQHSEEWLRMKAARGPSFPRYPTMAGWDSRGRAAMGATGSDCGWVRTYFDDQGDRHPLAVALHGDEVVHELPRWVRQTVKYSDLLTNDEEGWIRCPICQVTEKYQVESQASRASAQGRMAKHLLHAKEHVEAHRDLHLKVFGN